MLSTFFCTAISCTGGDVVLNAQSEHIDAMIAEHSKRCHLNPMLDEMFMTQQVWPLDRSDGPREFSAGMDSATGRLIYDLVMETVARASNDGRLLVRDNSSM